MQYSGVSEVHSVLVVCTLLIMRAGPYKALCVYTIVMAIKSVHVNTITKSCLWYSCIME